MPIDSDDLVWSEGYRAFGSSSTNPYLLGSHAYYKWNEGYDDAQYDSNTLNI